MPKYVSVFRSPEVIAEEKSKQEEGENIRKLQNGSASLHGRGGVVLESLVVL